MNTPDDTRQAESKACCSPSQQVEVSSCCGDSVETVKERSSCCSSEPDESVNLSVQADGSAACCGSSPAAPTQSESCCGPSEKQSNFSRLREWVVSVWGLIVLLPLLVWMLDPERIGDVLQVAANALGGTLPYIVIAVLMIAYLKATGAENMVARAFEGREHRMIVFAAFFGGLAPFCSCEVIPFVAGLLAVGAPLSAVMAFWLSSPLIDPPSLMITAGALGWEFAIGKAVAAVALGLFGGFGVKLLLQGGVFSSPLKSGGVSSCSTGACSVDAPFAAKPVWRFWPEASRRDQFRDQALSNALFLFKWLTLAYILEALLILYVPASLIGTVVGGEGVGPVIIGALVGMPAYLNSYAAPPLVAGLMEQGMSIGSAMAFMVAGAISSIPAMAAVWSLVRPPVFVAYLGFGVIGAILFGLGFAALIAG